MLHKEHRNVLARAGRGRRSRLLGRRRGRFDTRNVAISEDVQTDTVQFKTLLPAGMLVAVLCNAAPNPSLEPDTYTRSIREFGGNRVNPMAYSDTTAGFQSYLTDSGVKIVSARELILPNHPDVAARLGFHDFLPPQLVAAGGCSGLTNTAHRIPNQFSGPSPELVAAKGL
jgi:hypothetical protein